MPNNIYQIRIYLKKWTENLLFFPIAQQPLVGQGLLIIEASRSHSDTPHSVGLLWKSDQPDAKTPTWQHTTLLRDKTSIPPAGFEPAIPPREWPQTHALDREDAGIGRTENLTRHESYNTCDNLMPGWYLHNARSSAHSGTWTTLLNSKVTWFCHSGSRMGWTISILMAVEMWVTTEGADSRKAHPHHPTPTLPLSQLPSIRTLNDNPQNLNAWSPTQTHGCTRTLTACKSE
jgi:hypothetical protein